MSEPIITAGPAEDTVVLGTLRLTKHYGGVGAVENVSLEVMAGEVMAIVGDNGAGKTTFVKMLSGLERPTRGTIMIDGKAVDFQSGHDARRVGVETVHQDLALAENLPVWANLFLGREAIASGLIGRRLGWLDRRTMRRSTREAVSRLKVELVDVDKPVRLLSGGQRQAIAVMRAVHWSSRLVIMDEPTAALGPEQQAHVLELIKRVRDGGTAVMLISHSLPQVMDVADRVAVFRRGKLATVVRAKTTSSEELIAYITGARM